MPELPFKKSVIDVARARKPSLPRSLGIEEWSATDQLAWKEAIRPAVRMQRGGAAAHLAKVSQNDIANRYGLYLCFLQRNGLFDVRSGAAELVVPNYVQDYVVELKNRVSSVTLWNSIYKLRRASECLAPDLDYRWLSEIEKDLALVAEPRDKTDRLVFADRLFEAGLTLIEEAESFAPTPMRRARGVRNGLMIILLSLHPLRIRNFATLRIGESIRKVGIINRYVDQHRQLLLGKKAQNPAFWISSTKGAQFTIKNMGTLISKITKQTLGIDVSPHLFRMAASTTAAVYGTSNPHLATAVMGHRDKRITEEHYNRARSFHAGAILANIIETCKSSG